MYKDCMGDFVASDGMCILHVNATKRLVVAVIRKRGRLATLDYSYKLTIFGLIIKCNIHTLEVIVSFIRSDDRFTPPILQPSKKLLNPNT